MNGRKFAYCWCIRGFFSTASTSSSWLFPTKYTLHTNEALFCVLIIAKNRRRRRVVKEGLLARRNPQQEIIFLFFGTHYIVTGWLNIRSAGTVEAGLFTNEQIILKVIFSFLSQLHTLRETETIRNTISTCEVETVFCKCFLLSPLLRRELFLFSEC